MLQSKPAVLRRGCTGGSVAQSVRLASADPADAEVAFHRAIENAGGNLNEMVPNDQEGQRWTAPDGTRYERYYSEGNKDTPIIVILSPRAPNADGLWNIKIRFRRQP